MNLSWWETFIVQAAAEVDAPVISGRGKGEMKCDLGKRLYPDW